MFEFFSLFLGTVLLRPYVFLFLSAYVIAATAHMGLRRTLLFLPLGYSLAWISEFSSIHWGFPYGDYYYIPATMGRELWVWGVPFMDSLSYVFLSYCSYATAIFILSPVIISSREFFILETHSLRRSRLTLVLGAFLFVFLDVIIDPVAFQGHRWFLGQIYGYRHPGIYFGIPMSNFAGWLLVGFVMVGALQILDSISALEPRSGSALDRIPAISALGPLLYVSVLAFNLVVTFWIGEDLLGSVGCLLVFFTFLLVFCFTRYKLDHLTPELIQKHLIDFPHSKLIHRRAFTSVEPAVLYHGVQGRTRKTEQGF